jgi:GNAT superfamily N-acetyltransferase
MKDKQDEPGHTEGARHWTCLKVQMLQEWRAGRALVSTDPKKLDLDVIHGFLAACYWAEGIPRAVVERSIAGALCFGVYDEGKQVGFARVISDFATYAYLADVFLLESHRGRGLGKWLMKCILAHPELQGLRRWSLVTRDAHGLYGQYGFRSLGNPDRHMEMVDREIYQKLRAPN